jgi:hypothetical protein
VRDIKPMPLPLCTWQAIERAQKMFLELSEAVPTAALKHQPKKYSWTHPSRSLLKGHDLNPKNILGVIRFLRHLLDRSAQTEKCSWT